MKHTHLTDEQLIATCVDGTAPDGTALDGTTLDGTAACGECQARLASLATLLNEVNATANATADAAFPPERLARQHARILSRLVPHRQLARIIAFPHARHTSMPSPRPIRRWVAGAAAAGLVVGMVAGHLAHELPGRRLPGIFQVLVKLNDFLESIGPRCRRGPNLLARATRQEYDRQTTPEA